MRYVVKVKLPGEAVKTVGSFKTQEEANRCRTQWRNDYRINGQVVTIEEEQA